MKMYMYMRSVFVWFDLVYGISKIVGYLINLYTYKQFYVKQFRLA